MKGMKNQPIDLASSCEDMRNRLEQMLCVACKGLLDEHRAREAGEVGAAYRSLSAALGELRSLSRPKSGTVTWNMEICYFLDHDRRLRLIRGGDDSRRDDDHFKAKGFEK